jgi:hypothetical protein
MKRLLALFAVTSVALCAAGWFRAELVSFAYLGPPLMRVEAPERAAEVAVGSVDVLIEFPAGERVMVETFQCLLNGLDVTDSLTVGRNGAVGAIVGLREGDNQIRLRVFGRSVWTGSFIDEERDFVVRVRPLPFLDLA